MIPSSLPPHDDPLFNLETENPFKRILLTGVGGFIGSNLAEYLVYKYPDYMIVGLDKMSYCSSKSNFKDLVKHPNFKFIQGDINDIHHMRDIMKSWSIDTVLHLAAYTHVDQSFGEPIIYTKNNVLGTHTLVEVCNSLKINRFIHVSTDEVYGSNSEISSEKSILDPTNPYAATKAAAEQIVKSYYHSFKFPCIITRGNNVYGPRQFPEKLIPKFMLLLQHEIPCTIHGSGEQCRSFLYVYDVCRAFDYILHKGVIGEIYNIGCEEEISVNEMTKKLVNLLGSRPCLVKYGKDRSFNDIRYYIDTRKLHDLGWKPVVDIDTGLRITLSWYEQNRTNWTEIQMREALNVEDDIPLIGY